MYQVNFNTGKIFLVLFFGVFGISTAAIFVKLATETTGLDGIGFSLFLAASRLIISSLLMFPFWKQLKHAQIQPNAIKYSILAGICLAIHYVTWFLSLSYTSVTASTAIVTTCPIWVALISRFFFGEKLSKGTIIGIIIATFGGLIIANDGMKGDTLAQNPILGNLLSLVSAWVYSIYFLFGKEAQRKGLVTSLYAVIAYSASAITLFPLPYLFQTNYIGHPIIVYLYIFLMAIFAQIIGQNCLNLSLRWISPIIVTLAVMFEPIFAGILAYIVFDETPSYILLIGVTILLIGVGVTAVNLKSRQ
jgi:drug/metabolite transporter (DMT)-like permease